MVWARALLLEVRGDTQAALSILQTAWANPLLRIPSQLVRRGPHLVRLAVGGGRLELGRAVVEAVDEAAAGSPVATWRAAAIWCRGLLQGDADALVEAVAAYRQASRPIERARACEDAASALSRVDRRDEAAALLGESVEGYERVGAFMDLHDGMDKRSEQRAGRAAPWIQRDPNDVVQPIMGPGAEPAVHRGPGCGRPPSPAASRAPGPPDR